MVCSATTLIMPSSSSKRNFFDEFTKTKNACVLFTAVSFLNVKCEYVVITNYASCVRKSHIVPNVFVHVLVLLACVVGWGCFSQSRRHNWPHYIELRHYNGENNDNKDKSELVPAKSSRCLAMCCVLCHVSWHKIQTWINILSPAIVIQMKNVCKQQNSVCVILQDFTTACDLSHVGNQRWQFFFRFFPFFSIAFVVIVLYGGGSGVANTMASKPFNGLKVFRFEWRLLSHIYLLFRPNASVGTFNRI